MDFRGVITEIIRETSYKIDDFYLKSFLQGGPTLGQTTTLFEEIQKIKHEEFKVQAALHGVDLNSKESKKEQKSTPDQPSMVFGDPKEYAHLTTEEREELTQKMLAKHKKWAGEKKI